MTKLLLCYRSNSLSNSIVSSTRNKCAENSITGIKIDTINIDKRNLLKYIEKEKVDIMYVLSLDLDYEESLLNSLKTNYPQLKVVVYTDHIIYRYSKHHNDLYSTSKKYYLYEKIQYDNKDNFKNENENTTAEFLRLKMLQDKKQKEFQELKNKLSS